MGTEALLQLLGEWRLWASNADGTEDGWESNFPDWQAMMETACQLMSSGSSDAATVTAISQCWELSRENEEMKDYAVEHINECWTTIEQLAYSSLVDCRWQVYDAAAAAGFRAEQLLRNGLGDPDPYCRRRALLSLARLAPADASSLATRYLGDSDPYIRQAAIEMALASRDSEFIRQTRASMQNDPVKHVRDAATVRMALDEIA